ncbi:helix-turn-helix domain-containing protein [Mycolicibacterium aubagnense]|uniref:Antitoxin HigA2 n=1 Tax=Mycolicibacterium aubagnense TaxID=319707 RepID=A0ABN5YKI2_9MYCO|nr:helix-turn-helix transcriptional regulator [Mycolicibacterium aubagnense]TLH64439.1 XRE family transcriptional regulator [Mycolicibacterium aubagnense]BBX82172.1 putative antitoxin HigA2 [Mycolicibacterium aubagnense]
MSTLDKLLAGLPADRRERIERGAADMEREAAEYRLRQLREDAGYTQKSLAAIIGVGQNRVSQMEHGQIAAAQISTLRKYVEATGGELEVMVKRPDGTRIPLAL